jgi:hypothetical protein
VQPRRAVAGGRSTVVCTVPSVSVARTVTTWSPTVASHSRTHWIQVSAVTCSARRASCQAPPSICTSTFAMPVCGAHATPATATVPASTGWPCRGTSIRDSILIGPRSVQPRVDQYARSSANVVTFSSTTHFVAET